MPKKSDPKKAASKTAKKSPKAAKKAARKAAKKAAKKSTRKTAAKVSSPAVNGTRAKAPSKAKVSPEPEMDLSTAAYLNYMDRLNKGLPGDEMTDWAAAEQATNGS